MFVRYLAHALEISIGGDNASVHHYRLEDHPPPAPMLGDERSSAPRSL